MTRWRFLFALFAVVCLGSLAGCGGGGSSPSSAAPPTGSDPNVRVVNAVPNALPVANGGTGASPATVDVYIDGTARATGVSYTAATNYLSITTGSHKIQIVPSGSGLPATATAQTVTQIFKAGTNYTIFATGEAGSASTVPILPVVFNDTYIGSNGSSTPSPGTTGLRLVNAAPNLGQNVDVYVVLPNTSLSSATPVATNLAFQSGTNLVTVPSGTRQIVFTLHGQTTALATSGNITLPSGQQTVAAIFGDLSISKPLSVALPQTVEFGNVRVFNATTSSVDFVIGSSVLQSGLLYPQVSNYAAVPVGQHTVYLDMPQSTQTVTSANLSVGANANYTVFFGPISSAVEISNLVTTTQDLNSAPATGAVLRFVDYASVVNLNDGSGFQNGVQVSITGNGILPNAINLSYGQVSQYTSPIPAGTYNVIFTETGTQNVVAFYGGLTVNTGQVLTLVALGNITFPVIPAAPPIPPPPAPLAPYLLYDLNGPTNQ